MTINLEQNITYPIRLGASVLKHSSSSDLAKRVVSDDGTFEEDGFHLVSRQLPRTTTKLTRETLESGKNVRARQLDNTARAAEGEDRQSVLIEIDARDQKSTCTYEGDFEPVVPSIDNVDANEGSDDADDEIECVLIYDEESKAFVIERVASHIAVKSGVPSGVSAVSTGTLAGQLALPTNTHGSPKGRVRAASKRDTPSVVDEASEDELAKELEGMFDDASDMGDVVLTGSARSRSRRSSEQRTQKWESLDDQLNMELAENLDEALLEDVASDDDEFEEVDGAQFLGSETGNGGEAAGSLEVESLPDNHSDGDDDDDDDMAFEEVDPPAELDARPNSQLALSVSRAGLTAEFEEFEEIGTPFTGQSNVTSGIDDSLFSGSASPSLLSPRRLEQRSLNQARRLNGGSVSADVDTETLDGFEDLDLDLTRSLEDS
ncbi:hypothetical protein GGI20_001529 [Coemansia sp. BCRC 34301]|nr:hypothetical protein GGI20_001529 [Coemansia sp. BCRC 34301]